jgi:hypothetical protein
MIELNINNNKITWNHSSEKEKNHILYEKAIPKFKENKLLPDLKELTLVVDKKLVVAAYEPLDSKVVIPIKVVPHYNEVSIFSTRPSKAQLFIYSSISKRMQDKYPYMLLYHAFFFSTGDVYEFSNPALEEKDIHSFKNIVTSSTAKV